MKTNYPIRNDLISQRKASLILKPYLPRLREWLEDAWDWVQDILNQDAARRATFDSSIIAGMVYLRFVKLATSLEGESGIIVERAGRMISIVFDRQLVLRFKKFDPKLKSRNVGTERQKQIYSQQLELEGICGKPTRTTFGYVADSTNKFLESIHITCPLGPNRNKWVIEVKAPTAQSSFKFRETLTNDLEEAQVDVVPKPMEKTAHNGQGI